MASPETPLFAGTELDAESRTQLLELRAFADAVTTLDDKLDTISRSHHSDDLVVTIGDARDYSLHTNADDEYTDAHGETSVGQSQMVLTFNADSLDIAVAQFNVEGAHGGLREKKVSARQLPGFLRSLVTVTTVQG